MNKFLIKNSTGHGQGLFTTIPFAANEILFRFEGKSISKEEADKHANKNKLLQIATDKYLDLGSHYSVFTNHSCNPNCYVKTSINTAFLISARPILAGDELFFDYSLTSTDTNNEWQMNCNCHKFYCRKVISGFNSIPEEKRKILIANNIIPPYQY
jgi:hypothetical protein